MDYTEIMDSCSLTSDWGQQLYLTCRERFNSFNMEDPVSWRSLGEWCFPLPASVMTFHCTFNPSHVSVWQTSFHQCVPVFPHDAEMCEIINKVLTAAQKAFLDSQFYFIFYCCFFLLLLFFFLDPWSKKQTNKTATFRSCNCVTCMNACMEGTVKCMKMPLNSKIDALLHIFSR